MDTPVVVIDIGSRNAKAGFADDDAPRSSTTSMVGKTNRPAVMMGTGFKSSFFCEEVSIKTGSVDLFRSINRGNYGDWDLIEKLYHQLFYNELRCAPEENAILLTTQPMNPASYHEKLAEIMIETFQIPQISIQTKPYLSFFESGLDTGMAVQIGDGVMSTVAAINRTPVKNSSVQSNLAGKDLSHFLQVSLSQLGHYFTREEEGTVYSIKEKLCYVAKQFDEELKRASFSQLESPMQFETPNGDIVVLNQERFCTPEILFNPSIMERSEPSVQNIVLQTISQVDQQLQDQIAQGIVVAGGSTMFQGFAERLEHELSKANPNFSYSLHVPKSGGKNSAWHGGSLFAMQENFSDHCLTSDEYNEYGASGIESKILQ